MMHARPSLGGSRLSSLGLGSLLWLAACDAGPAQVGDDVVATVAGRQITVRDVTAQRAYLSEFGELSFGDDEQSRALLGRALVEATIMAEAGRREGLEGDPRFAWAMREEDARLESSHVVAQDTIAERGPAYEAALSSWYAAHEADFREPEQRAFSGVQFSTFKAAQAAIAKLRGGGEAGLADLGPVLKSELLTRDDKSYPTVHPFVFDSALGEGDVISVPLLSGKLILVALLTRVQAARTPSLEEPALRARVEEAFARARREATVDEYVETLRLAKAGASRK